MNEKDWRNHFDGSVAQGRSDRWYGSYDGLIFKDMGYACLLSFFLACHLNFCHFALSVGFTYPTAGAGPETVKKWYAKGFRTLDDLQRAKLTHQQKTGLKYYNVRLFFLLFSFEPRSFMYCDRYSIMGYLIPTGVSTTYSERRSSSLGAQRQTGRQIYFAPSKSSHLWLV